MNYEERTKFVSRIDEIEAKNKKKDHLHVFDHLVDLFNPQELEFVSLQFRELYGHPSNLMILGLRTL